MENNNKTILLIPDVHGRSFWREGISLRLPDELVVFLGDYTDPYTRDEGIKHDVVPGMLREILETPNAVFLLGNHDLSYVYPGFTRVRHDMCPERCSELRDIFEENHDRFALTHTVRVGKKTYIFSHAGLLADFYKHKSTDTPVRVASRLNKRWLERDPSLCADLDVYSWYRGGFFDSVGSCVWSDVREHLGRTNSYWDKVYQVFDHTMLKEGAIIQESLFACIDCKRPVRLHTNKFRLETL